MNDPARNDVQYPIRFSFTERLDRLNSGTGKLVFDVPVNIKLTALELHDSPFSGGVRVDL